MIKIFTSQTQSKGEQGEKEAAAFLMKHGFKIIERNVANKFGEIDIVAQKDKVTYFFEVKAGNKDSGLNPAENLHPEKIRKFLKSVEYYCLIRQIRNYNVKAILVLFSKEEDSAIELIDIF